MLRYTGHPLFDVGVATLTAFAKKRLPEELGPADLEEIAEYMGRNYTVNPMRSFLTVAFPNSGYTQPAYFDDPEKQAIYAERVLGSFDNQTPSLDELDVFLGIPSSNVPFDVKGAIKPGRAFRQHVPLTTGEGVINFHPYGDAGLPVSGLSLLAIQAFPLGSAKCEGKLLAVHSDHPKMLLHFARAFLESNQQSISIAQQQGSSKLPESHFNLRTLLIDTLLKADELRFERLDDLGPFSITAYHLSNSGQQPSLDIYHLPLEVIDYLRTMLRDPYAQDWRPIVQRAWERAPKPSGKKKKEAGEFTPRKNYLYEDIFRLPESAARFIRTYFLRFALRSAREEGDPRKTYSLAEENHLVSWRITEVFLERILNMDKNRINRIREMGDHLADYICMQNDRRFFTAFYTEMRYEFFRNALIKANLAHVKNSQPPIITFDSYLEVFEEGEEFARVDWKLARDLVFIRMVERLHTLEWLGKNKDALPDLSQSAEDNEETVSD